LRGACVGQSDLVRHRVQRVRLRPREDCGGSSLPIEIHDTLAHRANQHLDTRLEHHIMLLGHMAKTFEFHNSTFDTRFDNHLENLQRDRRDTDEAKSANDPKRHAANRSHGGNLNASPREITLLDLCRPRCEKH
jgi:hypothetical protein